MWRPVFCHADGLLSPRRVIVTPDEISAFIRRFFGGALRCSFGITE